MADEWTQQLTDYLIAAGTGDATNPACTAALLCKYADCNPFAGAGNHAGKDVWEGMYVEGAYEIKILQDDGVTENPMSITEFGETGQLYKVLAADINKGEKAEGGCYFGGVKHVVNVYNKEYDCDGTSCIHVTAGAPGGKGVQILCAESLDYVLVGGFDKEKGVSPGNCLNGLHKFIAYLANPA